MRKLGQSRSAPEHGNLLGVWGGRKCPWASQPRPGPRRTSRVTRPIRSHHREEWLKKGRARSSTGTVFGLEGAPMQSVEEYDGILTVGGGSSVKLAMRAQARWEDTETILTYPCALHRESAALESGQQLLPVSRKEVRPGRLCGSRSRHCPGNNQPERERTSERRRKPRRSRLDPPRTAQLADSANFQSRSEWSDLFNCIVALKDRSQFARHFAESIVNTFFRVAVSSASDPDV